MWFFLNGYVTIIIRGLTLERFIAKLCAMNIKLIDLTRISRTKLSVKVSRQDYKKIKKTLKQSMYDCRVMRKIGLYYMFMQMLNRPAFCTGMLLCVLAVLSLHNYVASIYFIGDANNDIYTKISQELEICGISKGANIKDISLRQVKNHILDNVPEVIFIGINKVGMDVIVEAIERPYVPEMQYRGEICNIIASKDCIITEMSVLSGYAVVNVGDTVKKGQLLVSGIIPTKQGEGEPLYKRAIADINARVFYSATEEVPKYSTEETLSGKIKREYELFFSTYGIIKLKAQEFEHSKAVKKNISMLPGILPITFLITEYHELHIDFYEKDIDTIYNEAKIKAQASCAKKIPGYAEITDIKVYYNEYETHMSATAYIECIEDVAIQVPLDGYR